MTRHNTPAYGAVKISPDGQAIGWFQPDSDHDWVPWLIVTRTDDPDGFTPSVEHHWMPQSAVAGWTDLQDPDVTRADDTLLAEVADVLAAADPVPAGLAERVRRAADATGGDAS